MIEWLIGKPTNEDIGSYVTDQAGHEPPLSYGDIVTSLWWKGLQTGYRVLHLEIQFSIENIWTILNTNKKNRLSD